VREEMLADHATPFSQLVGIQALLNVVQGERYATIPDENMMYLAAGTDAARGGRPGGPRPRRRQPARQADDGRRPCAAAT